MLPATHCVYSQSPLLLAPQLSLLAGPSVPLLASLGSPFLQPLELNLIVRLLTKGLLCRCIPHPLRDNNGAPVVGPHSIPCRSVIAACTRQAFRLSACSHAKSSPQFCALKPEFKHSGTTRTSRHAGEGVSQSKGPFPFTAHSQGYRPHLIPFFPFCSTQLHGDLSCSFGYIRNLLWLSVGFL